MMSAARGSGLDTLAEIVFDAADDDRGVINSIDLGASQGSRILYQCEIQCLHLSRTWYIPFEQDPIAWLEPHRLTEGCQRGTHL